MKEHSVNTESKAAPQKGAASAVERLVIRAFRTEAIGTISVVFAEKAGKARYVTMLAANDAGYGVGIIEVTVNRAAEYDRMEFDSNAGFEGEPKENWCYKPVHLLSV